MLYLWLVLQFSWLQLKLKHLVGATLLVITASSLVVNAQANFGGCPSVVVETAGVVVHTLKQWSPTLKAQILELDREQGEIYLLMH